MRNYRSFFRNAGAALVGVMLFAACGKEEARDVLVDSGVVGDCAWTLTGGLGDYTLAISGEGAMAMHNPLLDDPSFEEVVPWLQHASKINTLVIGDGITAVNVDAVDICSLTSIRVDVANPRYSVAGDVLFDKKQDTLVCYPRGKTGDYVIPGSVVTIGDGAFKYCAGLTSVTIPGSVTRIGTLAFSGCVGLTDVTIPASVTEFGFNAFSGCSGLQSVTNLSPEPQNGVKTVGGIHWISYHYAFSGVDMGACTLRVPTNAVEVYKAHFEWRNFGNIVGI